MTEKDSRAISQDALDAYHSFGQNAARAAEFLDIPSSTFKGRLANARKLKLTSEQKIDPSKKRISDLRREILDLRHQIKGFEAQTYNLETVKALIHETKQYEFRAPSWTKRPGKGTNIGTPFLHLSDWHWDEVVEPAQINYVNAYNRAIATRRAKTCFETAVDLLLHHMAKPNYPEIVVGIGGDMLSGNIHEELRETNEAVIGKTIVNCAENLVGGLRFLADNFGRVRVLLIPGNHGRLDKKQRYKHRVFETYEWIMFQFMDVHLKDDDRISLQISDCPEVMFDIYNETFLMVHGDEFKGGSGVSGVFSPVVRGDLKTRARQMSVGLPYTYMLVGHFHQKRTPSKGTRMNGSLKGFDDYAFSKGFDFELPMQDMFIVHPVWGITVQWPIILEKPGTRFGKEV